MKREIFEALVYQLSTLPWVKRINWEKIWLLDSDFNDSELPALQIYDTGSEFTHQGGRLEARTSLSIELVMKQTPQGAVSQGILFDRVEEIELKIGQKIDLGVKGMLHVRYLREVTDLHTVEPYFIARLDFEAIYLKPFTGCFP